ncbi:hypothetical protein D1632_07280 [Chryseobacterium nematophagum]|uniref:Uncharacterized protein n=2 Tax=Chryseobacterium nematophagum TaxID=2305228 RepID=A0A3M7LD90_9FLAO|nr:hypothetical protein D1632_07280 [Chryseobacterium nematophagum]
MHSFSSEISAACMNCSYIKDVFFFSLLLLIIIPITIYISAKTIYNKTIFSLIVSIIFMLFTFMNNYSIFEDRVASWSSYSFEDALLATAFQSFLYILAGGVLTFYLYHKFYKTRLHIEL